jgi:hypothetical protein
VWLSPELDLVLRGGLPKHRVHFLEGDPGTGKTTTGLSFLIEGVKAGERDIDIFELVPVEALLTEQQTVLFPSEVELGETVNLITERITAISPVRVVTDSISKLRLLGRKCTTLLLDDLTTDGGGKDLHSVVQGVIALISASATTARPDGACASSTSLVRRRHGSLALVSLLVSLERAGSPGPPRRHSDAGMRRLGRG